MLHPKKPKGSGVKTSLGGPECYIQKKPKDSGVISSFGRHECYIPKNPKVVV